MIDERISGYTKLSRGSSILRQLSDEWLQRFGAEFYSDHDKAIDYIKTSMPLGSLVLSVYGSSMSGHIGQVCAHALFDTGSECIGVRWLSDPAGPRASYVDIWHFSHCIALDEELLALLVLSELG